MSCIREGSKEVVLSITTTSDPGSPIFYLSLYIFETIKMPKRRRSRARRALPFTKRKRSRTTRLARRRRGTGRGSARGFVKSVALSLAESKSISANFLTTTTTPTSGGLFHNVLTQFKIIDNTTSTGGILPITGTSDQTRNGSDIYATGIMLRGQVSLPFDRRNTKIKMWYTERNTAQGDANTYSTFFKQVTGSGALDPVNDDAFKHKYLGELRTRARDLYIERGELTDAGAEATIYFKRWIPFRRHLKFNSTSSNAATVGMKEALSVHFLAYDTYATAETDRVCTTVNFAATLYFKDP